VFQKIGNANKMCFTKIVKSVEIDIRNLPEFDVFAKNVPADPSRTGDQAQMVICV
jgi:hypothetical protein